MRKNLVSVMLAVIFALSLSLFAGCGSSSGKNDLPVESGKDTVITDTVSVTPDNYDSKKVVYAAIGRLSQISTYKITSTGSSVADVVGLFDYTQQTDCFTVRHGDEYYVDSNSKSRFVTVKHEAFAKGENIAYRVNGGEIVNSEADAYKDVFGVTPDKLLSGHVFNDETILYSELISAENGEYTFKIVLDKDKGNALLFKQMKEFGGLNGYPVFTDNTVAELTVKEDYTPLKLAYTSKYIVNVSVLGDLPCVEKNTAVFSDFNEEVEIPDTEAFNAAMSSTPSQVIPSEDKPVDENQEKIVGALLKADLIRGVALNGVLRYNNVELPIKLNGRVDIDKIMNDENADILSLIDLRVSLGAYDDSLALTYHDKKLYVDLAGVKFSKELFGDENGLATATDFVGTVKDIDLASYVKVTKEDDDIYRVRLNNAVIEGVIKSALQSVGLAGENVDECYDLSVGLYIPSDRVGVISLNLTTDTVSLGADFNLSDEKFVLPVDEDYVAEPQILKAGLEVSLKLADFNVNATVNASYDILNFNPANALKAEANITLDDSLKSLMSLAGMFSKDLPSWLGTVADADTLNFVYENGKLAFVAVKDDKATMAADIPLNSGKDDSDDDESSGLDIDFETIMAIVPEVLDAKLANHVLSVNVKSELVSFVNMIWDQVPELIMGKAGTLAGMMLGAYIGKPIENIGIDFSLEEGYVELYIDAFDVTTASGDVYIEGREYDIVRLLSLKIKGVSADDYSFAWDTDKIYEDMTKANEVITAWDSVSTASMRETYTDEVSAVKSLYEGLTDDQKLLCYGISDSSAFDSLISDSEQLKTSVDDFAKSVGTKLVSTLNRTYNGFTDEQLDYLTTTYPDELAKYFEKRVENESKKAGEVKNYIETLTVHTEDELASLSIDEIYALFKTTSDIYEKYAALCEKSLEGTETDRFVAEANRVAAAYAEIVSSEADGMKYQTMYCEGRSVEELLDLYKSVDGFYQKYASAFSGKAIFAFVTEANPDFDMQCYLAEYYLKYNGTGFRKYAVIALESEIADLKATFDEGGYDEAEFKTKLGNIESLLAKTDSSAVLNKSDFETMQNAYYETLANALKTELPVITAKLKAINDNPEADDIDWEGVDAEATAYENKIKLLTDKLKLKLAVEIAQFNKQKSAFDENYFDYGV